VQQSGAIACSAEIKEVNLPQDGRQASFFQGFSAASQDLPVCLMNGSEHRKLPVPLQSKSGSSNYPDPARGFS